MIGGLIFLAWWVVAVAIALIGIYVISYKIAAGVPKEYADRAADSYREHPVCVTQSGCRTAHRLFWLPLAAFVVVVVAAAWPLAGLVLPDIFRGRAAKNRAEGQKEAMKTLAHYEPDAIAKKALEKGDGQAYVDRYLDLDRRAVA